MTPSIASNMCSHDTTFQPSDRITLTEMQNGEAVLLDLHTWNYYSLNETGVHVWKQASEGASVSEMIRSLSERWDVSLEESERAVRSLISELVSENLLSEIDNSVTRE